MALFMLIHYWFNFFIRVKMMKSENIVFVDNANSGEVLVKEVIRHFFKGDSLEAIVTMFTDGSRSVVWVDDSKFDSL
jgi:hypothetical protein